jgi:probable extracellular repeat, HAF family
MESKRTIAQVLFSCFLFSSLAVAQSYTVTDLGPLSPTGINAFGQVAGNISNHAVIWSKTKGAHDLGTMPTGTYSRAAAINDLGAVVGQADGATTLTLTTFSGEVLQVVCNVNQPFVWTNKQGMQGLGIVELGAPFDWYEEYIHDGCNLGTPRTYATGVNDLGQIVASNDDFNTYAWGYLWRSKTGLEIVPLTFLDWQNRVTAINNLGQFAGARGHYILDLDAAPHAAVWRNNVEVDLGTLEGSDPSDPTFYSYCSEAYGMNDLGQIVGWSTTTPGPGYPPCSFSPIHAVSWSSGVGIEDLGTLSGSTSSIAYAVNVQGQVVGSSGNTLYWDSDARMYKLEGRPFIWTKASGMRDLNYLIRGNSGWVLNSATAINVFGQIVGSGTRNGKPHGFLLTPKF